MNLEAIAARLLQVDGIAAVTLGGSRARGTHTAESDVDLGLYYRPPLDVDALGAYARELSGPDAAVTVPGGWGPWVDGGGWLRVDYLAVDWIYRSLDRVSASVTGAVAGDVRWHVQTGHPLGFPSFGYAAEVAAGVVLADPAGALAPLRARLDPYPPLLVDAIVHGLWEAGFLIGGARKAAPRGDVAYLAGCLFRAIGLIAHAVHAHTGRWVTNEKGFVASADSLHPGFAAQVADVYATLPGDASGALDRCERLRAEVADAVGYVGD